MEQQQHRGSDGGKHVTGALGDGRKRSITARSYLIVEKKNENMHAHTLMRARAARDGGRNCDIVFVPLKIGSFTK